MYIVTCEAALIRASGGGSAPADGHAAVSGAHRAYRVRIRFNRQARRLISSTAACSRSPSFLLISCST